jgi:hypothetical protein
MQEAHEPSTIPDETPEAPPVPTTPTPAKEWKSSKSAKPIEVPSGNIAMVRRRSLEIWWKTGKIPNLLLPMVRQSIATGGPAKIIKEHDWTEDELMQMVQMMDTAVVECVDEPRVYRDPVCKSCKREERDAIHSEHEYDGEERDPEKLYVNDVDFDDKAFIYQYVIGAVDDVASFRKQQAVNVEPVPDGAEVDDEAEQPARDPG